jgi:hypothetical protein
MTKKYLFVFTIFFFISCEDDNSNKLKYQEIAYNSLSQADKESLTIDWQDAKVYEGVFNNNDCEYEFTSDEMDRLCFIAVNENVNLIKYQKLIAVIFNTKYDSLLGPIISIVDTENNKVIGFVGRL